MAQNVQVKCSKYHMCLQPNYLQETSYFSEIGKVMVTIKEKKRKSFKDVLKTYLRARKPKSYSGLYLTANFQAKLWQKFVSLLMKE